MSNKLLGFVVGLTFAISVGVLAQDWYVATGNPVQRSLLSSADLRTEFASIQSDIADKLPVLTGNGGKIIAVNSGGTALEALSTGVPVASGGTGATTASGARSNLGLALGVDVLAYDAELTAISILPTTDGNFLVGNGSTWQAESGATARTSLGLGSLATASTIDNSNWSGTDLALANGGTGASTAIQGLANLGVLTAVKTADEEVTSSTTLQNDDHLVLAVEANSRYIIETFWMPQQDAASVFWKFGWSVPSGTTVTHGPHLSLSAPVTESGTTFTGMTTDTNVMILSYIGIVVTSATAGNLQLQWAQGNSSASAVRLKSGSWVRLTKIS